MMYWFIFSKNLKYQNLVIVVSSYLFYGWWDWRFLILIFISSAIDYWVGIQLSKTEVRSVRKMLLITSISANLGILAFFKYFNFFIENFARLLSAFSVQANFSTLQIILPVGISFYTFQTMSYSIDVFRKNLQPTNDFIAFSAYVSFFPQLVAGPIERAIHLLPQFYAPRVFDYEKAVKGMRQILWGFLKKTVIADNCAIYANLFFSSHEDYSGSSLLLGAFFFSFQIYGDFSGYSDIAIGTARLFGINLMKNFAYPYFARDIAEFWRRWHISLTTWFRDYVYFPLGGSRHGKIKSIQNTFAIFILSGLWHGANWTFVLWGFLNAMFFLPLLLTGKNRKNLIIAAPDKHLPSLKEFMQMLFTFILILLSWVVFRAESLTHAISYLAKIFSSSILTVPVFPGRKHAIIVLMLIFCFIAVEWRGRKKEFAIEKPFSNSTAVRWLEAYVWCLIIIAFGSFEANAFIYFQF